MEKDVLFNKLESLRHCIERIRKKKPETLKLLEKDLDLQDILVISLERAVQICVDIASHILSDFDSPAPKTMAESFDCLANHKVITLKIAQQMKKAVGFRNIAIHEYESLNWKIVNAITKSSVDDFKKFAVAISAWLEK